MRDGHLNAINRRNWDNSTIFDVRRGDGMFTKILFLLSITVCTQKEIQA